MQSKEGQGNAKKYNYKTKNNLFVFLLSLGALVATQRSEMPAISSLACLIPLILMVINFKGTSIFWISAIVFLYTSIDQSLSSGLETPKIIRYSGYIIISFRLYYNLTLSRRMLTVLMAILALGFLSAAFVQPPIFLDQFTTDIKVIALLFIPAIAFKAPNVPLALGDLTFILIFAVIGESVNSSSIGQDAAYSSYNSTKSLILIPIIWALLNKRYALCVLFVLVIVPVVFAYSTRMILVMLMAYILYHVAKVVSQNLIKALLLVVIAYLFVGNIDRAKQMRVDEFYGQPSKSAQMVATAVEGLQNPNFDLKEFFITIDKGRSEENALFFDRPLFNIIFGTGLGSGIRDENRVITAGRFDTAFTESEIQSGEYYNFHDFWVDLGTRFGLVGLGFLLFLILRKKPNLDPTSVALVLIFTPLLFFSTQGLLMLAIFMICRSKASTRKPAWTVAWSGVLKFFRYGRRSRALDHGRER